MSPTLIPNPRARVGSPFQHVAPAGAAKAGAAAEEMVMDLKAAMFPDREGRMMVVKDGVRDVRVV